MCAPHLVRTRIRVNQKVGLFQSGLANRTDERRSRRTRCANRAYAGRELKFIQTKNDAMASKNGQPVLGKAARFFGKAEPRKDWGRGKGLGSRAPCVPSAVEGRAKQRPEQGPRGCESKKSIKNWRAEGSLRAWCAPRLHSGHAWPEKTS